MSRIKSENYEYSWHHGDLIWQRSKNPCERIAHDKGLHRRISKGSKRVREIFCYVLWPWLRLGFTIFVLKRNNNPLLGNEHQHRRRRNWSVQVGRKGYGIHFMERSTNNYDRIFGNGRYYYGFLPGRPNKKIARGHQEGMTGQTESECCFTKTTLRLTKARFQWLLFEKWNSNCANVHHIRQIERWICLIKLNPILTIAKPHWSSFAQYYALCIC